MNIKPYYHTVQYYETDAMGIVHHSNYIRWFEEARSFFLEQIGYGYKGMEKYGMISPVLSVSADYRTMTKYYETVEIQLKIPKYNGIKLFVEYIVRDKETKEVRCTGTSSHCFLNSQGHPVFMKREFPEIHQALSDLVEEENKK